MVKRREPASMDSSLGGNLSVPTVTQPRRSSQRTAAASATIADAYPVDKKLPPLANDSGALTKPSPARSVKKQTSVRIGTVKSHGARSRRSSRLHQTEERSSNGNAGESEQMTQNSDQQTSGSDTATNADQQKGTPESPVASAAIASHGSWEEGLTKGSPSKGRLQKTEQTSGPHDQQQDAPSLADRSNVSPQKSPGASHPEPKRTSADAAGETIREQTSRSSSHVSKRETIRDSREMELPESGECSSYKDLRGLSESSPKHQQILSKNSQSTDRREKQSADSTKYRRNSGDHMKRKPQPDSKDNIHRRSSPESTENRTARKSRRDTSENVAILVEKEHSHRKQYPGDAPERRTWHGSSKDESHPKDRQESSKDESKQNDDSTCSEVGPEHKESNIGRAELKDGSRHNDRDESGNCSKPKDRGRSSEDSSKRKDREGSSRGDSRHKNRHESSKDSSRHKERHDSSRDRSKDQDRRKSSKDRLRYESSGDSSKHKDRRGSSRDSRRHAGGREPCKGDTHRKDRQDSSRDRSRHDHRRHLSKRSSQRKDRRDSSRERSRDEHRRDLSKGNSERKDRRDTSRSCEGKDRRDIFRDHACDRRQEEPSKNAAQNRERKDSSKDRSHQNCKRVTKDGSYPKVDRLKENTGRNGTLTTSKDDTGVKNAENSSQDGSQHRKDQREDMTGFSPSPIDLAAKVKTETVPPLDKSSSVAIQQKVTASANLEFASQPGPAGDGTCTLATGSKVSAPMRSRSSSRLDALAASPASGKERSAGRRPAAGRATRASVAPPPPEAEDSCGIDGPFFGFDVNCVGSDAPQRLRSFLSRVEFRLASVGLSVVAEEGVTLIKRVSGVRRSVDRSEDAVEADEVRRTPKRTRRDFKVEKVERTSLRTRSVRQSGGGTPKKMKPSESAGDGSHKRQTPKSTEKSKKDMKIPEKSQQSAGRQASQVDHTSQSSQVLQSFSLPGPDKDASEHRRANRPDPRPTTPRSSRLRSKAAPTQESLKLVQQSEPASGARETRRSTRGQPQPPSPPPAEPAATAAVADTSWTPPAAMDVAASPSPTRTASEISSVSVSAADSRSPPLLGAPPPYADDNACSFPSMPSRASDSNDSGGSITTAAAPAAVGTPAAVNTEDASPPGSDGYSGGDETSAEQSRRQRATPRRARRRSTACQLPDGATASSSSTLCVGRRSGGSDAPASSSDGRMSFAFGAKRLAALPPLEDVNRSPQFVLSVEPPTPPRSSRERPADAPPAIAGPSGAVDTADLPSSDDDEEPFLGWTPVSRGLRPVSGKRPLDPSEVVPAVETGSSGESGAAAADLPQSQPADVATAPDELLTIGEVMLPVEDADEAGNTAEVVGGDVAAASAAVQAATDTMDVSPRDEIVDGSVSELPPAEQVEGPTDWTLETQLTEGVAEEDDSMVVTLGKEDHDEAVERSSRCSSPERNRRPKSPNGLPHDYGRAELADEASFEKCSTGEEEATAVPCPDSDSVASEDAGAFDLSNIPFPESLPEDVGLAVTRPTHDCTDVNAASDSDPSPEQLAMALDIASIPLPGEMPAVPAPDLPVSRGRREAADAGSPSVGSIHRRSSTKDDASQKSSSISHTTEGYSDLNDNVEKESHVKIVAQSGRGRVEKSEKKSDVRCDSEFQVQRLGSVQYESDSDSEHLEAVSAAVDAELESNTGQQQEPAAVSFSSEHHSNEQPPLPGVTCEDSSASSDRLQEMAIGKKSEPASSPSPEHPTARTDESQGSPLSEQATLPAGSALEKPSPDSASTGMLPEIPPEAGTTDASIAKSPASGREPTQAAVPGPDPVGAEEAMATGSPSRTLSGMPAVFGERSNVQEAGSDVGRLDDDSDPKNPLSEAKTADVSKVAKGDATEPIVSESRVGSGAPGLLTEDRLAATDGESEATGRAPTSADRGQRDAEKTDTSAVDHDEPISGQPVVSEMPDFAGQEPAVTAVPGSGSPGQSREQTAAGAGTDSRSAQDSVSGSPATPQLSGAADSAASKIPLHTKPGATETRSDQLPGEKGAAPKKRPEYVTSPERKKSAAETGMSTLAKVLNQKFASSRIHSAKIGEKLRNYQVITDNIWLAPKPRETKQQKETRRMVCDCSLSTEELQRGERGCGADCLNRLLMIECGSRCPVGDRCGNKRFARRRYCRTEVFRTDLKGYGLRALQDLPAGAFIYEYVGEVLDVREFRRRRKEYARHKYNHQYFMALRGDTIVDATEKGNDSRFINHSCDPNSETQKWTVNGDLRIGFFTMRPVAAGEEITFDYQLRRYGRKAQRCFCGSAQCRGWIGRKPDDQAPESDDEDETEEEEVGARTGAQRKTEKAKLRKDAARRELGVEISRLGSSGLKSRQQTLELSRLMVRAESDVDRCTLLQLLRAADQPCRRLFLDYHGLRLIWTWMACGLPTNGDSPADSETHNLRKEILRTLSVLPIPDRTALRESRVLAAVERWAQASRPSTPPTPDTDPPSDHTPPETAPLGDREAGEIAQLAKSLLTSWSALQNVFRIPKKERLQRMREHEQEADRGYQTYLEQQTRASSQYAKRGYGCSPERRKRSRESPDPVERRVKKYRAFSDNRLTKEERRKLFTLEVQQEEEQERRRREEERRRLQGGSADGAAEPDHEPGHAQRQQQEELWSGHEQRCAMLGLDPYLTPIFDASFQYYWEPSSSAWQPYSPGDPAVPLVPAAGAEPALMASLPHHLAVFQSMAAVDLQQAQQYLSRVAQGRPPAPAPASSSAAAAAAGRPPSPPAETRPPSPPTEARPPSPPPQQPARVAADQLPQMGLMDLLRAQVTGRFPAEGGSASASEPVGSVASIPLPEGAPLPREPSRPPPPPEPEEEPSVRLPPKWRMTTDDTGKVYYYHQVTLESRWEPPAYPDSTVADPVPAGSPTYSPTSDSSSDSSSESSSDSSSSESSSSDSESGSSSPTSSRRTRHYSSGSAGSAKKLGRRRPPRTPSPALPEAPPPPRLTAPEEELEEGEIPDITATDRMLKRWSQRHNRRKLDPLKERPPSPPAEPSRAESRRHRRQERANARRERRRDRECERLLRKHRRLQQKSSREGRSPGDEARHVREEAIRRFKEKEEALLRQQELAAQERRRAEAEAEAAAAKRRKLDPKRSSSVSSAPSSSSAAAVKAAKVKPTTAAADTSSETAKKIKDKFLVHMSAVVVSVLNGFRKPTCQQGRITSTEDFKLLAKKLTHHVLVKELRSVKRVEDLVPSDPVKHKARYYVRKYMSRFGELYVQSSTPGATGRPGDATAADPMEL